MNYVNKNSKTFCVLPFTSLTTEADGGTKICCMSSQRLKIDGSKSSYLKDNSLEEFWNCDQINEIRHALTNGEYHPNCELCWTEEKAKCKSKRIRDNKAHDKLLDNDLSQPQILDLKLGNKCNIACRTCGTHSSTGWIKEELFFADEGQKKQINRDMDRVSECFSTENTLWKTLDNWLPNINHFDFYGGEPMLIEDMWDIIKKSVKLGYSKKQKLHFNTNGTVFRTKYLDLFKEFRWVDIQFSIDGIEDRFEFMRYPAKWDRVLKHIKKYMEFRDANLQNISAGVCLTISNFNVYYIDEVVNFFENLGIGVYLNLVHWPDHQNITNIPIEIKKKIDEKVRTGLKNASPNWHAYERINNIINFMYSKECISDQYEKWVKELKDHDKYRKENFTEICKDYANILPGF